MSMKKILMAAVAVTALTAGTANAVAITTGALTAGSTVGGVTLNPTAGAGVTAVYDPYTLANEVTTPATTTIPAVIRSSTTSALTNATQYLVTYNITNGTFITAGTVPGDIAANGGIGIIANSNGTVSTSQVQFVVTTGAGDPTGFAWTTRGIRPLSTKLPVSVTTSIALMSSPTVNLDGGTSAAITLIDFRDAFTFTATAANPTLSIASGFKKFAGAAAYADVATAMGVKIAGAVATSGAGDVIYKDGATALVAADVATAVLTITGDLTAMNGRLGAAQLADASTTNVFTADGTNLPLLRAAPGATPTATFGLVEKTVPLVGVEGGYSVTPVITLASGLTAPTFAATKLGSVSFEGTALFVPWVSDGVNGTNNVIRIGNKSTTAAVTSVKASLLNPTVKATSGTVASTTTCELGTIAASGEMVINSAALKTCFGSFTRSDVRLTVQGAAADLTLKMRSSTAGITTENLVGSGVTALTGNN
jgi:hypothetical protein